MDGRNQNGPQTTKKRGRKRKSGDRVEAEDGEWNEKTKKKKKKRVMKAATDNKNNNNRDEMVARESGKSRDVRSNAGRNGNLRGHAGSDDGDDDEKLRGANALTDLVGALRFQSDDRTCSGGNGDGGMNGGNGGEDGASKTHHASRNHHSHSYADKARGKASKQTKSPKSNTSSTPPPSSSHQRFCPQWPNHCQLHTL